MLFFKKVIYDRPGQTCNRFWSYLDTVSWAVLNRKHIAIMFWDESIADYGRLRRSKYVSFPLFCQLAIRLFGQARWSRFIVRNFSRPRLNTFYAGRIGRALGFVEGWPLREGDQFFPLVRDEVRAMFIPNEAICAAVEDNMSQLRKEADMIVGVHIRRGDYASWKNGTYYYDHHDYARWMEQIESVNSGKKVCFYVASNEPIPQWMSDRFRIRHIDGKAAHNLYSLQLCDYLIGPPSTFSKWASIMGNVPYLIVFDNNMVIHDMSEFCPLKSHTVFENGRAVW